jgi:hypothetical protein
MAGTRPAMTTAGDLTFGCLKTSSVRESVHDNFRVMCGLDPRIHHEHRHSPTLRKTIFAEHGHGLPGQARP